MSYGQPLKKQKKSECTSLEWPRQGAIWIYTCVKRSSYFFVSFAVGKWDQETCRNMLRNFSGKIRTPTPANTLELYSDGNDDYTYTLPEFFDKNAIIYGQNVKIREKGKVVGKIKRRVFGEPASSEIETTDVENFNGILRAHVSRLVRRTKCISKTGKRLEDAITIFQFYWNFIKPLSNEETPAMKENVSDRIWSWRCFLLWKIKLY